MHGEPEWQAGIRASRFFVAFVSRHWMTDPVCQQQALYARALGKPFRVLLLDDEPLPADVFADLADVQIARVQSPQAAAAQITRWVTEDVPDVPPAPQETAP